MKLVSLEMLTNKPEKKAKERTQDVQLNEKVTFEDLNLRKAVIEGLRNAAYLQPSPIQLKAIPLGKLGLGNAK